MRLTNIRERGRYKNTVTGQEVNVKIGRDRQRSTDHLFYQYRGKKMFISDLDFYSNKIWVRVDNVLNLDYLQPDQDERRMRQRESQ
jgi:hypothetical protein